MAIFTRVKNADTEAEYDIPTVVYQAMDDSAKEQLTVIGESDAASAPVTNPANDGSSDAAPADESTTTNQE